MRIKNITYKGVFICFIFSLIFLYSFAWAIELPYINKSKIRVSISPGKSSYGEIIIENSVPETRSIRAYLEDWRYLPAADGTKEFLPANTTPLSCASWISFSPSEFTLGPFSKQKLTYSIRVPPEAKGGYYAVLFFESVFSNVAPKQEQLQAGMNIAIRVATLFYVEVESTIKRTVQISNYRVEKKIKIEPLTIKMDFKNTGNVDITAGGNFNIINDEGIVLARGLFNDIYTFPGDTAIFSALWKEPLPEGKYDLVVTLNLGKGQEEAGMGRGQVIVKEAEIEIGKNGGIIKVGDFK